MHRMRAKDPRESFVAAYVFRPLGWALFNLSRDVRAINRYRRKHLS